jgi:hypothetical protein
MKKTFSLLFFVVIVSVQLFSQAPQSFKYQAIARDGSGNILANQTVTFQISILSGSISGPAVYSETHSVTTNDFGLVTLDIGQGAPQSGSFSAINWSLNSFFLKTELDPAGGTAFLDMGTTQLLSVPYALYAQNAGASGDSLWGTSGNKIYNLNSTNVGIGTTTPVGKLEVKQDPLVSDTLPLFEVKNKNGHTVFVVYPDSAHFFVYDDGSKSNKGSFAVSGRNSTKSLTNNLLLVSPDSTRVYLDSESSKGGFAVKGFNNFGLKNYLNVAVDTTEIIDPSQARIVWYPSKEAFLSGRVLIESPDSVGQNSMASGFESKALGSCSHALGFRTLAHGNFSTSIGRKTDSKGYNSFALGDSSVAYANRSFAIGYGASAKGIGSIAMGTAGVDEYGVPNGNFTIANGNYTFAAGMGAVTTASSFGSIAVGSLTVADGVASSSIGCNNYATGTYASAIGFNNYANGMYALSLGANDTAVGIGSMAIGFSSNATGQLSLAIGANTEASGISSSAIGYNSTASGNFSTAYGHNVSTNGQQGAIIFGDYSSLTVMNSTNTNQFKVRASGGYIFHCDPTLAELNSVYISALTGNLGLGTSSPARKLHVKDVMRLEPRATPPIPAAEGDIYYSSIDHKLKVYNGTLWMDCY